MSITKWFGHEIHGDGIKPNETKVQAIMKLKPPENTKELKSVLGAKQQMAKFFIKLIRTDRPIERITQQE